MEIPQVPAIDVSHLPTSGFGQRTPLWWGVLLAITIETTGFALVWSTYLYLRMQEGTWPPWGWSAPNMMVGAIATLAVVATWPPMMLISKAAKALKQTRVRMLLVVFFLNSLIACGLRYWEFVALQIKWDSNAYGSTVWAMLTLHTVHLLSSLAETGLIATYTFTRPLDPKHALDLEVSALYWYFVVGSGVINSFFLYLGPHILN